jgi:hypothetical protein
LLAGHGHLEGLIVLVTTNLTLRHLHHPLCRLPYPLVVSLSTLPGSHTNDEPRWGPVSHTSTALMVRPP